MTNPTITPSTWSPGASVYTVDDSDFAAVDVVFTFSIGLGVATIPLALTVPAGATVHAVRNPSGWNDTETALPTGASGTIVLGVSPNHWNVTIVPGAPATVTVEDPTGNIQIGTIRFFFRALGGNQLTFERTSSDASIDRVLAGPSIQNLYVSNGLPVTELKPVWLDGTVSATQVSNGSPTLALSLEPSIVAEWTEDPSNPAAVGAFTPSGTHAEFEAPAVYANTVLNFQLKAAYDLDNTGLASATNPTNQDIIFGGVMVETATHAMIVVIDRSGSMGGGFGSGGSGISRWDAAVRASHAWLDLFRSFRGGNLHKAGIVTFDHNFCNLTMSTANDVSLRDPLGGATPTGMSALAGFGDNNQPPALGTVQNCTPIGDALIKAWTAIGAGLSGGSGDKRGAVLLLTDGYENAGHVRIAATAGTALFATERSVGALTTADSQIDNRLFTLAVGQQVDAQRLALLGAGGSYLMTSDAREILPAFADMIGQVLHVQAPLALANVVDPASSVAVPPGTALYFPVNAREQRVAFLVPWGNGTDDLVIAWRPQGVAGTTPFAPINNNHSGIQYYRRDWHGLLVVDIRAVIGAGPAAAATEWRIQHKSGGSFKQLTVDAGKVPQEMRCLVDLVLRAEVSFDQPQYFVGDPIRLSCRISNGGARVKGANVEIDVARPGEGLGTFLATNASRYRAVQKATSTGTVPKATADPPKGKGHMHATLLDVMGLHQLPMVVPPVFKLHDDGAHGDGPANNGDYSNVFTDTVKEGTYTFRYRIEGQLPDGSRYSRLFVRSTWVGIKPDPGHLGGTWIPLTRLPRGVVGSVLTLTPRTASGEYLGPFQTDVIALRVAGGELDGELVDNLDGSYSQRVIHVGGREPVVSIDIHGERMEPTGPGIDGPGGGADGRNCSRLWSAAFRCTLRAILRAFRLID